MAKETAAELFIGTDHQFVFEVLNEAETAAVDITGWSISWMLKRKATNLDAAALLTKTTSSGIAISGTYNSNPSTNTQIATVTIADTDTDAFPPGMCVYELKRTGAGVEVVLAHGPLNLRRSVHHT